MPHTNTCLSTVKVSENDILKVVRKLDPSKAHGHDKIIICMLKLSDKAICKPLHMIFTTCLETGFSQSTGKKATLYLYIRKLVKNCRPGSLLLIYGEIFEPLIHNEVYPCRIYNNLISLHHLGFKGGDSCINQLPPIMHEIYNLLMKILRSAEYFYIYPRHSIGCGITVLYSNFRKVASLVKYCCF